MADVIKWLQCDGVWRVIVPLVVGVIGAWVTARLAIRQFKSQKWWERKCDEYLKILESLHGIKSMFVALYCAGKEGRGVDAQVRASVEAADKAMHDFGRMVDRASLVLSKGACRCLQEFIRAITGVDRSQGDVNFSLLLDHIDACRKALIDAARKDLGIR